MSDFTKLDEGKIFSKIFACHLHTIKTRFNFAESFNQILNMKIQEFLSTYPGIKPEHLPLFEKFILLVVLTNFASVKYGIVSEEWNLAHAKKEGFLSALNLLGYDLQFVSEFMMAYFEQKKNLASG